MQNALDERRRSHWNEFTPRNTLGVRFYQNHLPIAYNNQGLEWGPERHDENNVVIEKEMADLAKNSAYMEALQQVFKNKTMGLKAALRDRVA
jgi:flagellar basal body rod protein FlgB